MNFIFHLLLSQIRLNFFNSTKSKLSLAVSGGQDSIILFFCFFILKKQCQYRLNSIYCNHLWQTSSLKCYLHLAKFQYTVLTTYFAIIVLNPVKTEHQAREWRFWLFERLSTFTAIKYYLLGHTASDKIETFLMNLIRGTGVTGLCSIVPDRFSYSPKFNCFSEKRINLKALTYPIGWNEEYHLNHLVNPGLISIQRPLLSFNRYEIRVLLDTAHLPLWVDSTNQNFCYMRNRIRYQILPMLRFYLNQKVDNCIGRCSEILTGENIYLNNVTLTCLKTDLIVKQNSHVLIFNFSFFRSYPTIIQKRLLLVGLKFNNKFNVTFALIHKLLKTLAIFQEARFQYPQPIKLSDQLIFILYKDKLILLSPQ